MKQEDFDWTIVAGQSISKYRKDGTPIRTQTIRAYRRAPRPKHIYLGTRGTIWGPAMKNPWPERTAKDYKEMLNTLLGPELRSMWSGENGEGESLKRMRRILQTKLLPLRDKSWDEVEDIMNNIKKAA